LASRAPFLLAPSHPEWAMRFIKRYEQHEFMQNAVGLTVAALGEIGLTAAVLGEIGCTRVLCRPPYAGAPSPRGFLALHTSLTKPPFFGTMVEYIFLPFLTLHEIR
jgi:hypothetical protein